MICPVIDRDLAIEAKAHATGFARLYAWLEGRDLLVIKADRRDALCVIPLHLAIEIARERDFWLRIGAALHSLDDSWEHRRRGLWDAWSRRSSKFDPEDQEKTWEGFDRNREDGVTWRTIEFEAVENGWSPATDGGILRLLTRKGTCRGSPDRCHVTDFTP